MIEVKATVLPFFEFLAPHKAGQPLYLVPERAAVLCLAELIIARDSVTGAEKPIWGTDEFDRLVAGEDLQCGLVLVVELNFANELEDLVDLVTAVRCGNGEVDDEDEPADDAEDDEADKGEDEDDAEDADEDFDDDFDEGFDEVGEDDEDDEEDDEEDEEEGPGVDTV